MNEADRPPKEIPLVTPSDADRARSPAPPGAEATLDTFSPPATSQLDATSDTVGRVIYASSEIKSVGPYRLLQLLGEGGMGEVWLAEQKIPIHRTVALKLIKAGMDTKAVVARFESERQALALMDHSSIARVFDAGSTSEGRPYFVMEYVPGLPITDYCDKHRLSIKERLELFLQVCDGVQHAHQKAIIHRDLKPSNVLVVEHDSNAVPKIIDFGLAKATAQRLTEKTLFTELGVMIGTPEYMSPEQADQREQNIDTRTDVYSLGVILYELLVGARPFDAKALRAAGLDEILRMIREVEPLKPSTRIRSMGEASAASAEKRREEPRTFAQHVRGELDWITMKSLEKDRVRRYGGASDLAADIGRYLRSEPVVAGPKTLGYRLQKYAVRHRIAVGVAAGLLVLLTGFIVTQALELRRITSERNRANRERDRATRITDFMEGMFKVSNPSEARGDSITAREILDKASTEINAGLAKDPETQAQLMDVMGDVYESLGLYSRAQPLLERALEIQRGALGPRNAETLTSMNDLAWLLFDEARYPEAEKLCRETLNIRRQVLGQDDPGTLITMRHLASTLGREGRYAEAEGLLREILDIERRVLGPEHPETLVTINGLAVALDQEGRYDESEKLERQALEIKTRVLGPEHPSTLKTMGNLSNTLLDEGRYAEAEKMQLELLGIERRVLGPEHPDTLRTMSSLAGTLEQEGRYADSEGLGSEIVDIQRRVLGPDHPDTAATLYNLGRLAARTGERDRAFSLLREAVDHGLHPSNDLFIDRDPYLESLHGDPRFAALVADAEERAGAAQKPH